MKYLFLINEKSRYKKLDKLEQFITKTFSQSDDQIVIKRSKDIPLADKVFKNLSIDEFNCIVACGGDGTINFVLNQIIGKNISLGIIPIGTVNALARSLGFPRNIKKVVQNIKEKKAKIIDVGLVNDKYFLCFASIGFDAMVVHYVPDKLKGRFGKTAFAITAFKKLLSQEELNKLTLHLPDRDNPLIAYSILLSNTPIYAGVKMFPEARVDDGLMDLFIFKKRGILETIKGAMIVASVGFKTFRTIAKSIPIGKGIQHIQTNTLKVESEGDIYLQLDGDPKKIESKNNIVELNFSIIQKGIKILGT